MTQVSGADAAAPGQVTPGGDGSVTLLDIYLVLHRNKAWLLAGILSGIVLAMGWVLLAPSVYESSATIHIGAIREKGTLEEPAVLTVRLMDRYGGESAQTAAPVLSRVVQASLAKNAPRSPNTLKLVTSATSPEDAEKLLTKIVETVAQEHSELYEGYLTPLRQQLGAVDQEINAVKIQMRQLSGALDRLIASHPVQASLLALEKGRLVTQLNLLEIERFNLSRQINDPFSASTRVVTPPTLPKRPASPSVFFMAVSGVLLGLALGIVAAYLRDLYSKMRAAQDSRLSISRRDGNRSR